MTRKTDTPVNQPEPELPLEHYMLDTPLNRYHLVNLAISWAEKIRNRPEAPKYTNEILELSLREILTGKVKIEEIENLPSVKDMRRDHLLADRAKEERAVAEGKKEAEKKEAEKKESKKGKRK